MKENKKIILCFDVGDIPLNGEMPESLKHYDRYHVDVPVELFPKELLDIIEGMYKKDKSTKKYINNISVCIPQVIEKPLGNILNVYKVYYMLDNESFVFKVSAFNKNNAKERTLKALRAFDNIIITDIEEE